MIVDRALTGLLNDFPDVAIERVDILTNPRQAWEDGIRMVPALKNKERILSGILLAKKEIRRFLTNAQ